MVATSLLFQTVERINFEIIWWQLVDKETPKQTTVLQIVLNAVDKNPMIIFLNILVIAHVYCNLQENTFK